MDAAATSSASGENVKVVVRCRPISDGEKQKQTKECIKISQEKAVTIFQDSETKDFTFDHAFGDKISQAKLYEICAAPIVNEVLKGFNATVFAYGQTGSGKTHTMQGGTESDDLGIIPRAFQHIFSHIESTQNRQYLTHVSYLEIYNEEVRDLLAPVGKQKEGLEVKENPETGFYVKDLSVVTVKNASEVMNLLVTGNRNRSVGATLMNAQSSRSHSIFTITVESCEANAAKDNQHVIAGKLSLVDLAGSERQTKTGATGTRLKEAAKINLSLSVLGNCISALVDGKSNHIPYRDSKLTKLLQDSLGGNAKTMMIATVSPVSYNYEESMSTLRYANRAKNIKNKPKINQDPKDALLSQYQEEIERLKSLLSKKRAETAIGKPGTASPKVATPGTPDTSQRTTANAASKRLNTARLVSGPEKEAIAKELQAREEELNKEKQARAELATKLADIESKLVVGGIDISQHVETQKATLELKKAELVSQKEAEKKLKKKVGANQAAQSQLEEKYASLQEEIDVKSKKLKKLFSKLDEVRAEKVKMSEDFFKERMELQDTIHELTKELAFKDRIIEDFIPTSIKSEFEDSLGFSEETNEWALDLGAKRSSQKSDHRPLIDQNGKMPLSLTSRFYFAQNKASLRHRPFNIIPNSLEKEDQ